MPARAAWRICLTNRLRFLPVAEALPRLVSDSNRRMIYEFAMDTFEFSVRVLVVAVGLFAIETIALTWRM